MPCRCCGAPPPSKGLDHDKLEIEINSHLKKAAALILSKDDASAYIGIEDWKEGWIEAFEHHLYGCKEKQKEPNVYKDQ